VLLGASCFLLVTETSAASDLVNGARRLQIFQDANTNPAGTTVTVSDAGYFTWAFYYYTVYSIMLFLLVAFAIMYYFKAVEPVLQQKGELRRNRQFNTQAHDFESGMSECLDDKNTFIHGLCCSTARMAHTNAVAGVLGFWETIAVLCCCAMFIPCGQCCIQVWFRMQLKKIMNVRDNICNDIVITCCCPCLAICQQAQAVDSAMGYEVHCCCDLEWDHPSSY
jgi:Cys-rich protein (TIGR01571 family)